MLKKNLKKWNETIFNVKVAHQESYRNWSERKVIIEMTGETVRILKGVI